MAHLWQAKLAVEPYMPTPDTEFFSNVAEKDHLKFFGEREKPPNYRSVLKFLEFTNRDVAKATRTTRNSVRFDERISPELRERLVQWANLINLVAVYFKGDLQKTFLWFTLPNPLIGNVAPREMIRFGRSKKLLEIVREALN